MVSKKDVFVIMPFSATPTCTEAEWAEIYEQVFRPAFEACGYSCDRAIPKTGSLIASIVERLKMANLVLADITDRNPNVFYELGVRHSLSKRTIVVCQSAQDIPSDLRGYWWLEYGIRPAQVAAFRRDIKRLTQEIEEQPDKSDNPVSDYLEREHISISAYQQTENVKKLGALCTELSGNRIFLGSLLLEKVDTEQESFLSTDCLRLLIQTMYVDIGEDLLKQAYELMHDLRRIEKGERDEQLIGSALANTDRLATELLEIRASLSSGQYEEPATVSTMEWKPAEDNAVAMRCWKRYHEFQSRRIPCSNSIAWQLRRQQEEEHEESQASSEEEASS